ncbi:MAG: hypothetical protein K8I03_02875 [Ignavibacteria bacterium]|nr:hypothetical protein [Ignavibacteria bacterium]
MKYKIKYELSGSFLRVELSGELPLEQFSEISNDMDSVIDANGIDRVLFDMRKFKQRFGVFNGLKRIESFDPNRKYIQFAILDVGKNKDNNDFFENASFNRGFKMLFFYDETNALKWLQVDTTDKPVKVFEKEF